MREVWRQGGQGGISDGGSGSNLDNLIGRVFCSSTTGIDAEN